MGFAAVARVTEHSWTACAVQDEVNFVLVAGGQRDLHTTLCFESRAARASIVIDHFTEDPVYGGHHTAQIYKLGSYISVPIDDVMDFARGRLGSGADVSIGDVDDLAGALRAVVNEAREANPERMLTDGHAARAMAPAACSRFARAQCCVAPSLCFPASKRDAHAVRRALI